MRKALIGLLVAATAMTPIVAASAQEWRGRGTQQQAQDQGADRQQRRAEWQAQRAERQAQRSEAQSPRVEGQSQRSEGRSQRFQGQSAPVQADRGQGRQYRFQRNVPTQSAPQAPRTRQFSREQWQGSRGDRAGRFQRQAPVQVQPTQQAQTRQYNRERNWTTTQRGDWNGTRSWDRNQTRDGSLTRSWDGNRTGTWDGNRTRDRNRSGTWNGRNYSWNRDGRTYSWNSDWRRNNRYDWQGYRRYNRSVFNLGSYYAPYRNYSYRRFSVGFFLEPLFFSSNYWIGDPWQYRLPAAYPGTRWVRYYDDVLLVDIYSGEVIDVIYDFFW